VNCNTSHHKVRSNGLSFYRGANSLSQIVTKMGSLCAPQSQSSLGSRNQVNQLTNCLNLCPECQAIFDNWHERDNWSSARPGHLHHDVVGLQKSAGKGCLVCALFMHGLHDDTVQLLQQERPGFKSFVDVGLTNAVVPDYYHIKLLFYVEGDDLSTETRHLPRTVVEAYPSGRFGVRRANSTG
jgi:hypothetical protein